MFGIGTQEFLVIVVVGLLLFGGKRIPEVARSIGTGLRDFRRAMRDVQREVDLEGIIRAPENEAPRTARVLGSPAVEGARAEPKATGPVTGATGPGDVASEAMPRTDDRDECRPGADRERREEGGSG
ncbi:MAG: twin-arginine translocase TatA/TatE family subunit [Candidatus Eisenbacteria bacterium]